MQASAPLQASAPMQAATPMEAATHVQVTDAWIRWLPGDLPCAGYMTLVNTGSVDRSLVAVTTAAFAEVSIHQSREDHGMSSMRAVDSIILEPQVPVRFAEGGYHLMLMRRERPIRVGETIVMTLHFAKAPPLDVTFHVRAGEAE
jgi:copper(I)-binding protein